MSAAALAEPALPALDPRDFRRALGSFPTGVTVVTARAPSGAMAGVTVNSFASVSLEPPLVLWSLAESASTREIFQAATHFAVHVLAEHQQHLSQRFAKWHGDKFAGIEVAEGLGAAPLIAEVAACFECQCRFRYYGGDHIIFVGQVERYQYGSHTPLVFHRGGYASLAAREAANSIALARAAGA